MMKRKYYIITGTSRGIGEALARKLISPENYLICISRNHNPRLKVEARVKNCTLMDICYDLTDVHKLTDLLHHTLRNIKEDSVEEFILVNNAGTVQPIGPVGKNLAPDSLIRNLLVNLVAPVLVTQYFIKMTQDWSVPRKILNLSSGAAQRPIHGWAPYCAGKAGLEMYARTVACEQENRDSGIKIVSFAPGVVDTEMQEEIRDQDESNFKDLDRFIGYKENGQLLKPEDVSMEIIDLLNDPGFGKETIMRTRLENERSSR